MQTSQTVSELKAKREVRIHWQLQGSRGQRTQRPFTLCTNPGPDSQSRKSFLEGFFPSSGCVSIRSFPRVCARKGKKKKRVDFKNTDPIVRDPVCLWGRGAGRTCPQHEFLKASLGAGGENQVKDSSNSDFLSWSSRNESGNESD